MNKVLLSIGTNVDREANLMLCHKLLNESFGKVDYSDTSVTTPYGGHYNNDFLNQLAIFFTELDRESICSSLKLIEKQMGRDPSDKEEGIVKIDIDIIVWNEEVLKPSEINRSYIADLLSTFKPRL